MAAERLGADKDTDGEVRAYFNLYEIYSRQDDRIPDAQAVVRQALKAVSGQKGSVAEARALILKARSLYEGGQDLGGAYHLLRDLDPSVFSPDRLRLKQEFLTVLGNVCSALGRFAEAQQLYRKLVEVTKLRDSDYAQAMAKFNLAYSVIAESLNLPDQRKREQVKELFEESLQLAEQSKHSEVEMRSHLNLGDLLSANPSDRADARRHYRRSLELAGNRGSVMHYVTRWALAWNRLQEGDEEAARNLVQRAKTMKVSNDSLMAYASRPRLLVSWALGDKEQAIQESRQVLASIESLRGQQFDHPSRERLFSAWTSPFYIFSGFLLRSAEQDRSRHDLEEAFRVTEQMRARVLLEVLTAGRATPAYSEQLAQIRADIAHTNRALRTSRSQEETRQMEEHLRSLELDENEIRSQAIRQEAEKILTDPKAFARLNEVEEQLTAQQALLSFQIGLWEDLYGDFGGGAWLLVSVKGSTRVYPLEIDRTWLEKAIPVFLGLVERRDGLDALSAPSLYKELLADAINDLPDGIRHLILIPDGPLHQLPFGLLRSSAQAPVLAQRYQLSVVPSATLWQNWTSKSTAPTETPALALVDPQLPETGSSQEEIGRSRFWGGEQLQPLPNARQEGSRLVSQLGGGSQLVVGEEASEKFLKNADLSRFALLHFASHAVVNNEFPERSAVILSPGDDDEDGWLQISEIVDLNLEGRLIVLAACRSASGSVLSGEGVIGLARAFFRAGARSVIGSLWRLRDDDAEEFFAAFYRELAEGKSIAAALNAAQMDRLQDGQPADAWAGLVVLGDGNYIPFPGGLPQASPLGNSIFTLIAALATAAILGAVLVLRSRKRKGFPA